MIHSLTRTNKTSYHQNGSRFRTLPRPLPELVVEQTGSGRFYVTPEGNRYRSVTTFLGSLPKEPYLIEWAARVGETYANKIKSQGANRGSRLHNNVENYLLGNEVVINNPLDKMLFSNLVPFLNRIDNIIAMEAPLYSDELQLAGRCDLIATVDSIPYIIDFKTATQQKEIPKEYWLQTTAYSIMFAERTGINIPRLCIAASSDDGHFQEQYSETAQWEQKLKKLLEKHPSQRIL